MHTLLSRKSFQCNAICPSPIICVVSNLWGAEWTRIVWMYSITASDFCSKSCHSKNIAQHLCKSFRHLVPWFHFAMGKMMIWNGTICVSSSWVFVEDARKWSSWSISFQIMLPMERYCWTLLVVRRCCFLSCSDTAMCSRSNHIRKLIFDISRMPKYSKKFLQAF